MTTAFIPGSSFVVTWRHLAVAAAVAVLLLVALTAVVVANSGSGGTAPPRAGTAYDARCAPTTVVHAC